MVIQMLFVEDLIRPGFEKPTMDGLNQHLPDFIINHNYR